MTRKEVSGFCCPQGDIPPLILWLKKNKYSKFPIF